MVAPQVVEVMVGRAALLAAAESGDSRVKFTSASAVLTAGIEEEEASGEEEGRE